MLLIDAMTGRNPGKTVAIILGGVTGVAFLVICLLFARSLKKKHDGMSYMWQQGMMGYFLVPHFIPYLLCSSY